MIDGSLTQLKCIFHREILRITLIHYTISIGGAGANSKHFTGKTLALTVNIVKAGSLLIPSADHGSH